MCDTIIIHGVACIWYYTQLHLWPLTVQCIRCRYWTNVVKPPLNSYTWNVPYCVNALHTHAMKLPLLVTVTTK